MRGDAFNPNNQAVTIVQPIPKAPDLPKVCPLLSRCQQSSVYRNIVKMTKAKSTSILSCPEIWERVSNCPHILEDAFYVGVIGDGDLLHYLKCEIFSCWFWSEAAKLEKLKVNGER
jgi:hypothetical protein